MISFYDEIKYPKIIEVSDNYWTSSNFFDVNVEYLEKNEND